MKHDNATDDLILTSLEQTIFATCLSLLIIVGLIMNFLVLFVLYKNRSLRQSIASHFLVNLTAIDAAYLAFITPFNLIAIIEGGWSFGQTFLKINAFGGTLLETASVLALGLISFDRLAAVMRPLSYRARMTQGKAFALNGYVWGQAIFFATLPLPSTWWVFDRRFFACTFSPEKKSTQFILYVCFFITCNYLSTLIVVIVTYSCIYKVARSHGRRIACAVVPVIALEAIRGKVTKDIARKREISTAVKISFVISAVILCSSPYATVRFLELTDTFARPDAIPEQLTLSTKVFFYMKSAINPFVYFLLQKKFRNALCSILFNRKLTGGPLPRPIYNGINDRSNDSRNPINSLESRITYVHKVKVVVDREEHNDLEESALVKTVSTENTVVDTQMLSLAVTSEHRRSSSLRHSLRQNGSRAKRGRSALSLSSLSPFQLLSLATIVMDDTNVIVRGSNIQENMSRARSMPVLTDIGKVKNHDNM